MKHTNFLYIALSIFLFGFTTNKTTKAIKVSIPYTDTITSISGSFNSYYFINIDALGNLSKDSLNTAEFYPPSPSSTIYAGNITLNGTGIPYDGDNLRYLQNPSTNISMNYLNWNISGDQSIIPFSYSLTPNYPLFDFSTLPDTCLKTVGINITLTGLQNTDPTLFVCTAIMSQNNGSTQSVKTINSSAINGNTVFFSSQDLASFNPDLDLSIVIALQNYKYVTIGSQNYVFVTSRYYKKESFLKP